MTLTAEDLKRFAGGQVQIEYIDEGVTTQGQIYRIECSAEDERIFILQLWTARIVAPGAFVWESPMPLTQHVMNLPSYTQQEEELGLHTFRSTDGKERVTFFPPGHPELIREDSVRWDEEPWEDEP